MERRMNGKEGEIEVKKRGEGMRDEEIQTGGEEWRRRRRCGF